MTERRLDAPLESTEEDVAEQGLPVNPDDDADESDDADRTRSTYAEISVEVDPADRAEQDRSVGLGDDEYR